MTQAMSMQSAVDTTRDAYRVASAALPVNADPVVRAAVVSVLLREFLHYEYADDISEESTAGTADDD